MSGLSANSSSDIESSEAMASPEAPLRERLFPQLSLRFLLGVMAVSAAVLWTTRAAFVEGEFWAKCAVAVLGTVAGCFILYATFFLLALLLATISFPMIREVLPENGSVPAPPRIDPPQASSP